LAPHDVGLTAEGDALSEENSEIRESVVEGTVYVYVLHRVLYLRCTIMKSKKKGHAETGEGESCP
jgi:hypothetical protein